MMATDRFGKYNSNYHTIVTFSHGTGVELTSLDGDINRLF